MLRLTVVAGVALGAYPHAQQVAETPAEYGAADAAEVEAGEAIAEPDGGAFAHQGAHESTEQGTDDSTDQNSPDTDRFVNSLRHGSLLSWGNCLSSNNKMTLRGQASCRASGG
jgi:hypothetical protein